MELVEAMAAARWRLRRISTIETSLLDNEMVRRSRDIDKEFRRDNDGRLAWVFRNLADNGQSLALLMRYEGALNRSYDRAFKQLQLLQSAPRHPQPNEPKPDPALSPVTPDSLRRRRACPPPTGSEFATDPTPTSSPLESPAKPIPPTDGHLDL